MLKLISVVLILLLYVLSGYGKIVNFDSTVEGFITKPVFKHMPLLINQLIMVGVIVLLIGGSFMIVYSLITNKLRFLARLLCIALAVFTVFATLLYHWPPVGGDYYHTLKNTTAVGGLLLASELFK